MQHVKSFTKIFFISLIILLPLGQTSAIAGDGPMSANVDHLAPININTASAEQLSERLNGVGMKRAENIIQYRDANGEFTSVEQLLSVKGIGEKVLEKNREHIALK